MTRGVLGREASRRDLVLRRMAARLKRITMAAAGAVAEETVGNVLEDSLRRATRFIRLLPLVVLGGIRSVSHTSSEAAERIALNVVFLLSRTRL